MTLLMPLRVYVRTWCDVQVVFVKVNVQLAESRLAAQVRHPAARSCFVPNTGKVISSSSCTGLRTTFWNIRTCKKMLLDRSKSVLSLSLESYRGYSNGNWQPLLFKKRTLT